MTSPARRGVWISLVVFPFGLTGLPALAESWANRPPSLLTWSSPRREVALEVFTSSAACGAAGCHPQTVVEWESSSHRHSGLGNPWVRATVSAAQAEGGEAVAAWCAGCHSPSLAAAGQVSRALGEKARDPGLEVGVSCTVCHSISAVHGVKGQAGIELTPPVPRDRVFRTGFLSRWLLRREISRKPQLHRAQFLPSTLKAEGASRTCAACHRGAVAGENEESRWVEVFDDYTSWTASEFSRRHAPNGLDFEPRGCVDCHMPWVPSNDLGSSGGRQRSHRFAAANTALPSFRGDTAQLEAVRASLQSGVMKVELYALIQGQGAELDFRAPLNRMEGTLRRGGKARLDVLVRNLGVGHAFPGGKQDLHESWLEVTAHDDRGRLRFQSGRGAETEAADPEGHPFGVTWIGERSELIVNHRLWESRLAVNPQLVPVHGAQLAQYEIPIPVDSRSLTVAATLRYRSLSHRLTRWVFAQLDLPMPRLPIVDVARDSITLTISPSEAPPSPAVPAYIAEDAPRWNSYGLALMLQGRLGAAREAFLRALDCELGFAAAKLNLGRVLFQLGDLEAARRRLEELRRGDVELLRARLILGQLERQSGNLTAAVEHLRAVAAAHPGDFEARLELGRTLLLAGDAGGAAAAIEGALELQPTHAAGHYLAMQIYGALRDAPAAARASRLFSRYRLDPGANILMRDYFQAEPQAGIEMGRHVHHSLPLSEPAEGETEGDP